MNYYVTAAGIILLTILIVFLTRRFFQNIISKRTDENNLKSKTSLLFYIRIIVALIYVVGFAMALQVIPATQKFANSLLTGAGILAAAAGFASQEALGNLIAGLFIIVFKPFQIGDRVVIKGNDIAGLVMDINLRHTVIKDYENQRIVVPNGILSSASVMNADLEDARVLRFLDFDIGYTSNVNLAKRLIAEAIMRHPDHIDGRSPEDIEAGAPQVKVSMVEWGAYYIRLRAFAWAKDQGGAFRLKCTVLEELKETFEQNGIEIPYPYQNEISVEPNS